MNHKESLLSWLKDAYAMEKQSEEILEHRLEDVAEQPEMRSRIQEHLNETRSQAERVKGRIEQLGGQISQIKTGLSGMIGYFGGRASGAASDEAVKNGISDYTNESMEIASYEAIKAGAEEMGDSETAKLADEILEEEKGMAAWLSETMPGLVKRYLSQTQAQV